jgi:ACS family tartrate transporter-like MFS transporter
VSDAATSRKVARRLIPFLFTLYVVCFLDRVNVGFAALQMNRDLGLSATAYGLGAGILFVGYALFEVPSNIILARVGARRWIARIAITWGLVSCAMLLVRGAASFYALRFLLGVAEAGFFPGIVYYLSNWFPQRERARAISWFMLAIPISAVIGGPLSGAILGLSGRLGLRGWQWLFLVEGLPAVVLGFVALRVLTDAPRDAVWLSAAERAALEAELESERGGGGGGSQRMELRRVLTNGTVWALGLLYALGSMGTYGLALWLPQIIRGFSGASDFAVGLMSALPNVAAAIAMVFIGWLSDRGGRRAVFVAWCGVIAGVGFAAAVVTKGPVMGLVGLSLAAIGVNGRFGPFWALPSMFLAEEAAAAGIALINSLGATAGFLAPYVIGKVKDVTGSFAGGLWVMAGVMLASAAVAMWISRRARVA